MDIAAPFVGPVTEIQPDWIDDNGHLNAGYYMVVFDLAVTDWMAFVGLGPDHRATHPITTFSVEGHITYDRELLIEHPIEIRAQLLAWTPKKIHWFQSMHHHTEGWLAATNELMSLHISQETRRPTPMADAVQARLAEIEAVHTALPVPPQVGRVISVNARKAGTPPR